MDNAFTKAIGDPDKFVAEIPELAGKLKVILGLEHVELKHIREAAKDRELEIADDEAFYRALFGGFAAILIDWYAQRVVVRGFFKKKVMVESKGFRCEFWDLFYWCVFEGLDLAPEGEGLPRKV